MRRLVAVAWLWLCCVAVWATDGLSAPQRLLKETADFLLATVAAQSADLREDPARLQALVRQHLLPHVDFARLSGLAVGRAWRDAMPEQRLRFITGFENLLVRTYATGLLGLEGWEIRYPPQRIPPEADDVVVRTEILRPGAPPVPVDYRMHRDGGRWRVYDLVIEGISFASTYRTAFEQEVRQAGLDGLIDRLGELNSPSPVRPPPPS
jgi:phospholipid transport system substrate-binding protein